MDEVSQKATPGEWQTLFVSKSTEKKKPQLIIQQQAKNLRKQIIRFNGRWYARNQNKRTDKKDEVEFRMAKWTKLKLATVGIMTESIKT